MNNLDEEFAFDGDIELNSHFAEERSKKLKRIKRAVEEGTYHINSQKLANKLIFSSNFFVLALLGIPGVN